MENPQEIENVDVVILVDHELLMSATMTPDRESGLTEIELAVDPYADITAIIALLDVVKEQLLHVQRMNDVHELVQREIEKQQFDAAAAFDIDKDVLSGGVDNLHQNSGSVN